MNQPAGHGGKRTLALASIGGLALVGLAIGGGAIAVAATPHSSHPVVQPAAVQPVLQSASSRHVFARNAAGLSYGSELDAATPADAPDLIAAYATNGQLGYVLRKDLHPAGPNSPQAALQAQVAQANKQRTIPVYAVDGKTKIGVYEIAAPTGS